MTNSELHEAESCRNLGCSPPETLELGARGNAEKNSGPKLEICGMRRLCRQTGVPTRYKMEKTNKNGIFNECGSMIFGGWNSQKDSNFNNRPKKAQMYL